MLVLFETPAGYAVFKLKDEKKLQATDNLYLDFETPDKASKVVQLKHFKKFEDTTEALAAASAHIEGKMSKSLKKLMKKIVSKDLHEELAVSDAKLGNLIKEKFDIPCVSTNAINELMRGIRSQANSLITGLSEKEFSAMALGLAHSLSRYKLKFSPDKVDTMIVQAISLLDDLDKELNNYSMRCREWYGWHFPELAKIVTDNLVFSKTVKHLGIRQNAAKSDFSELLPEEVEEELKAAAEISMGTDISDEDIENVIYLCDQVIQLSEYRAQLYDYLKNRMQAIAPNLTVLVGELVGARLIAHAGSLLNLAKHPSSTVQILGAEKALFRALKTKHDTPKYGLIYHASLVGQTSAKMKGKISRMLASKASLAIRYDALGEDVSTEMGIETRAKLEARLRSFEQGQMKRISGTGKSKTTPKKFEQTNEPVSYNTSMDSTISKSAKKRKHEEVEDDANDHDTTAESKPKKDKKKKKVKVEKDDSADEPEDVSMDVSSSSSKKKKSKSAKKDDEDEAAADDSVTTSSGKKKKKKKSIKHDADNEE